MSVTDLEGKRVVDMAIFNLAKRREKLSTSYSRTRYVPEPGLPYIPRDKLLAGGRPSAGRWMKIVEETPGPNGIHDTHNRMCNRFLYKTFGFGPREGCQEIIPQAVEPYGIPPGRPPDTMDLFMN